MGNWSVLLFYWNWSLAWCYTSRMLITGNRLVHPCSCSQRSNQGRISSKQGPVQKKMWGPLPNIRIPPDWIHTTSTQWQCCHHRHIVKDSHNHMHTEQKVWSNLSLRQQNYLNYPTFTEYFVITWLLSDHVLLWGPIFVEAPVRPNMLNMAKSASGSNWRFMKR